MEGAEGRGARKKGLLSSGRGRPVLAREALLRRSQANCSPPLSPPDVLMLLMTDVLVFLQEKDQKYSFPVLVRPSSSSLSTVCVSDLSCFPA